VPITAIRIDLLAAAIVRAGSVSTKGLDVHSLVGILCPWRAMSSETRRRLIAASRRTVLRQRASGPLGLTLSPRRPVVTKRTLYYHFASKDDLIAAYLEER